MDYEKDQIHYVKSTSSTIICKNFVKIDQREVPQKVLQAVFKNDRARSFLTCSTWNKSRWMTTNRNTEDVEKAWRRMLKSVWQGAQYQLICFHSCKIKAQFQSTILMQIFIIMLLLHIFILKPQASIVYSKISEKDKIIKKSFQMENQNSLFLYLNNIKEIQ